MQAKLAEKTNMAHVLVHKIKQRDAKIQGLFEKVIQFCCKLKGEGIFQTAQNDWHEGIIHVCCN